MTDSPILRRTPFQRTWSLVAPRRSGRPQPHMPGAAGGGPSRCPFCPGHEADTEKEVFALRQADTLPDSPGWTVRVVPNKYPALSRNGCGDTGRRSDAEVAGRGFHEVIVETPNHDVRFSQLASTEMEAVLRIYRARLRELGRRPGIESIALFRNEGRAAGASQEHAHAQVLAMPIVTGRLEAELESAERHLRTRGTCLTCEMLQRERQDGRRIVAEDGTFVTMTAFAPRFPYETWIVPAVHGHDFRLADDAEIGTLAATLGGTLAGLERTLGPFAYNLILQTVPPSRCDQLADAFHWRFEIVPRVTTPSGFELGTDVFIVSITSEEAAAALRSASADPAE